MAEINAFKEDITGRVDELCLCVQELTNLLLGDAYTHKAIVEAETSQIPVASCKQHITGHVEKGYDAMTLDTPVKPATKSVAGNDHANKKRKNKKRKTDDLTDTNNGGAQMDNHWIESLQGPTQW